MVRYLISLKGKNIEASSQENWQEELASMVREVLKNMSTDLSYTLEYREVVYLHISYMTKILFLHINYNYLYK